LSLIPLCLWFRLLFLLSSFCIYFISWFSFTPSFVLSSFILFQFSCLSLVPFLTSIIYSSLYLPFSFSVYLPLLYPSFFHFCPSISLPSSPLKYSIYILLTVRF
jgi:hypothetical protein